MNQQDYATRARAALVAQAQARAASLARARAHYQQIRDTRGPEIMAHARRYQQRLRAEEDGVWLPRIVPSMFGN